MSDSPTLNEKQIRHFDEMVSNVMMSRQDLFKKLLDPRRDIDADCGFPTGWLPPELFYNLYDRDGIAARVVEVFPEESWKVQPTVYESETQGVVTPFEDAWNNLGRKTRQEVSHYHQAKDSTIWEYLSRADTLSRIGQYGVILLGLNDVGDIAELTKPVETTPGLDLNYIKVFPEYMARVTAINGDRASKRFGMPERYSLTFSDPNDQGLAITGVALTTLNVHWSRLVHISSGLRSSEWLGIQAMRPVLNYILSLRKVVYGAGEMYWRGAFPGISLETIPQLGGDVKIDRTALGNMMEAYMNSLQRYIALTGMTAKTLAPTLSDPSPFVQSQIECICIKLGIPIRIFKGSERGELASTQDDDNWNDRMKGRQHNYITPRIICPFIDRLINLGILPVPENGYKVKWPDLTSMSAKDRADIANIRTSTLATYVQSGVMDLVPPREFYTKYAGFSDSEASALIKAGEDAIEVEDEDTEETPPIDAEEDTTEVNEEIKTIEDILSDV